jgi:hypothetical protein
MSLDRKTLSLSFSLIIISIFRLISSSYVWMRTKNEIDNIFNRLLSKEFFNKFDCCSSIFLIFELKAKVSFVKSEISFSWILFSIVFDRRFFFHDCIYYSKKKLSIKIRFDELDSVELNRISHVVSIHRFFSNEVYSAHTDWSSCWQYVKKKQYSFNQEN